LISWERSQSLTHHHTTTPPPLPPDSYGPPPGQRHLRPGPANRARTRATAGRRLFDGFRAQGRVRRRRRCSGTHTGPTADC
jgi:hypothetical protein